MFYIVSTTLQVGMSTHVMLLGFYIYEQKKINLKVEQFRRPKKIIIHNLLIFFNMGQESPPPPPHLSNTYQMFASFKDLTFLYLPVKGLMLILQLRFD